MGVGGAGRAQSVRIKVLAQLFNSDKIYRQKKQRLARISQLKHSFSLFFLYK